jgi:hypothetical protein
MDCGAWGFDEEFHVISANNINMILFFLVWLQVVEEISAKNSHWTTP